nr:arylesterase [Zoogloeaceae bacterium]
MWLRSIVTFVFISFFGPASADADTILVWGDSLSAGYGLRPGEAWPNLLQTRLAEKGFPHRVVNASVSGETSAGGRTRLPAALAEHTPRVLVLELGANDGLRGLRPQLMDDNLTAMIAAAQAAGSKVLLVGMRMPPNYGPAYTHRFQATYTDVATRTGVPLVPFLFEGFADQADKFQSDGIHPRADAQITMLDTIWPHLTPLLD